MVFLTVCEPELYLDFQGGIVDKSKNSLSMGIQNVHLDGGAGAFYGQSHLKLWRFSGSVFEYLIYESILLPQWKVLKSANE